ncbi:MAG: prepilin-type N-terminal cleavage/methylation domain-containing protein [Patescibacteria group bacterium]
MKKNKGFTLLELLIVIGILAILATIVALVLNPAELLKQARDSQRLSDLRTINSAIGLWVASASSTTMAQLANAGYCTKGTTSYGPIATCTENATTTIAGLGWININFTDIPGGSPLSRLPLDPVNSATYYYQYNNASTTLTFELDAKMESQKYGVGGPADVSSNTKDGGNNNNVYEIGTDPGLDLI